MFKRFTHIIVLVLFLLESMHGLAQIAMPDTVCVGTARRYQVNTPATPSTYTWTLNGAIQNSITNELNITWTTPGLYLVTVLEHANNGCDGDLRSGTVLVKAPPVPNAGPDQVICFGSPIQLNGQGGTVFHWTPPNYLSNPNIANPSVHFSGAGVFTYMLQVSDNSGCINLKKDTVVITVRPPVKVFAGNDTNITMNKPFQLNAIDVLNSGFTSYTWAPSFGLNNPQIKTPITTLDRDMIYIVTARTADDCVATDDIRIRVFKGPEIYVPTIFTPNKDGLNDIFIPTYVGIKELKYFSVYNRFGELIYTTTSQANGWNGTFKGTNQGIGAYAWIVAGTDFNGRVIKKSGTVVLAK
jgi:gliding motility-associated-like protein